MPMATLVWYNPRKDWEFPGRDEGPSGPFSLGEKHENTDQRRFNGA